MVSYTFQHTIWPLPTQLYLATDSHQLSVERQVGLNGHQDRQKMNSQRFLIALGVFF